MWGGDGKKPASGSSSAVWGFTELSRLSCTTLVSASPSSLLGVSSFPDKQNNPWPAIKWDLQSVSKLFVCLVSRNSNIVIVRIKSHFLMPSTNSWCLMTLFYFSHYPLKDISSSELCVIMRGPIDLPNPRPHISGLKVDSLHACSCLESFKTWIWSSCRNYCKWTTQDQWKSQLPQSCSCEDELQTAAAGDSPNPHLPT